MENLFDVIGNRMFSVFASKDRRANYELLLFIYDTFTQDECMQVVEKGEIVDKFAEYIKQHAFLEKRAMATMLFVILKYWILIIF